MATRTQTRRTRISEAAIWERLMCHGKRTLSGEAARYILGMEFPKEDKDRMHELAVKAQQGRLTAYEEEEIETYSRVGSVLGALKSRARMTLKSTARKTVFSLGTERVPKRGSPDQSFGPGPMTLPRRRSFRLTARTLG